MGITNTNTARYKVRQQHIYYDGIQRQVRQHLVVSIDDGCCPFYVGRKLHVKTFEICQLITVIFAVQSFNLSVLITHRPNTLLADVTPIL